jgi:hypothetical protein
VIWPLKDWSLMIAGFNFIQLFLELILFEFWKEYNFSFFCCEIYLHNFNFSTFVLIVMQEYHIKILVLLCLD